MSILNLEDEVTGTLNSCNPNKCIPKKDKTSRQREADFDNSFIYISFITYFEGDPVLQINVFQTYL